MYSPPPDEAAEALARDPIDPVEATERFLEDAAAETDRPSHHDEILSALRELRTYGVWLAHIDAKLEAWRDACASYCDGPPGSPRQAPDYQVRVASSRATQTAWRTPGDAWTDDQTFAPGACDASRFAFAVVRSEAARRVAFDHGWFRRWSSPTAPEAVDVLCEVGQVVLRVAAGEALISEEAMKAPYLKACVVSASWRSGCVEVELEVSGRHEFRVARVVAETADATQIHDANGDQRATRAAHAVRLRIACAAPKARPASPVNVVDSPDSVPESRVPAVRVLVLVE